LVKFFAPLTLLITILGVSVFGFQLLPNLLFGLSNVLLVCLLYSWLVMNRLPFSVSPKLAAAGQASYLNIVMLIVLPIFAAPHYFLFDFPWVLCIGSVCTIGGALGVLYYVKGISWEYLNGQVE